MRKLALPTLLAALFAAALYWVLRAELRSEAVAPGAAQSPQERDDEVGQVALAPPARTAEIPAIIESAPEVSVAEQPAAEETPPDRLAGTIVVVDELGVEHRDEDGRFALVLWGKEVGFVQEVEVSDGTWETEWDEERRPVSLGLREIVLGGGVAIVEGGNRTLLEVPPSGRLELRARWVPDTVLRVRDAVDGRELAPVLLVETQNWFDSRLAHPSERAEKAVDWGPSPVRLVPSGEIEDEPQTFYVGSPGFVWGRVRVDESRGGERVVDLARGGELEVELTGEPGAGGAVLRARRSESQPFAELPLKDERRFEIAGLPAGVCELSVEIGSWWGDPVRLGAVSAEVVPGERTRVVLSMRGIEPARLVPFSGTLVLPSEWELDRFELAFALLDTPLDGGNGFFRVPDTRMVTEGERPEVHHWSAPDAQAGRYQVSLDELAFSAVIELPSSGTDRARVEVPPPCTVRVSCVDSETGAALSAADLDVSWTWKPPAGVHASSSEPATWEPDLAGWVFRAPVGEVLLSTSSSMYEGEFPAMRVTSGENELELRVDALCVLRLVLRDGDVVVPWDEDAQADLEPLDGQEAYYFWPPQEYERTLSLREPGRYLLRAPPLPGYEPIPDEVVVLEKGVTKEHAIELRRSH